MERGSGTVQGPGRGKGSPRLEQSDLPGLTDLRTTILDCSGSEQKGFFGFLFLFCASQVSGRLFAPLGF